MRKARRRGKRGEDSGLFIDISPKFKQRDNAVTKSVIKLSKIVVASIAWDLKLSCAYL